MSTRQLRVHVSDAGLRLITRCGTTRVGRSMIMRFVAWLPIVGLPIAAFAIGDMLENWAFMWLMLLAIVGGCKWLTWCLAVERLGRVGLLRSVAYLLAWQGLDGQTFLDQRMTAKRPVLGEWLSACLKTIFGVCLIWACAGLEPLVPPYVLGWLGMVGLAFLLHFGLFHLLALMWRSAGIAAERIFRAPALANSLGNFWGSRWNLAFRDLAHALVFQPLVARIGVAGASLLTFLVSGMAHELVISVPARAGYGLPTLYFSLQWLGIVLERSRVGRRLGLRRGLTGWLLTLVVVVAPSCLLFHKAFVTDVMVPFLITLEHVERFWYS